MQPPLIDVRHFTYTYPRTSAPVLEDISFTIRPGEFVGIVGSTGSGKTTLCLALCGLIPHILGGRIQGEILLAGKNVATTPLEELAFSEADRQAMIGITVQDPEAQLVGMTVEEDLAFGPENLGVPSDEINLRVEEILRLIRMEGYRNTFPYTLSGGQKQRIAIGSMLALRPKILILDEPTSELDPVGRSTVFSILQDLKNQGGLTVLVVEHHTEELAQFAERIIVLQEGKIALDDAADQVFSQIELLNSVGVRPPECAELLEQIRDAGIAQPPDGLMAEEAVIEYLRSYLDGRD